MKSQPRLCLYCIAIAMMDSIYIVTITIWRFNREQYFKESRSSCTI